MKLFTSIILGGVLQVLAVSASRAAYINPDTANALDCFFWYVENGGPGERYHRIILRRN